MLSHMLVAVMLSSCGFAVSLRGERGLLRAS